MGTVDGLVAWISARSEASGVGTREGVGFGSSFGFARAQLGEPSLAPLPEEAAPRYTFSKLRGVAFGFGKKDPSPADRVEEILLFDESLLPGAKVSFRGLVLSGGRVAFDAAGVRHEAAVKAAALPPVGALVEADGTRERDGSLSLGKLFAADPVAADVPEPLKSRLAKDPDLLSYAALLAVREGVTDYSVEAIPGEASAALLVLRRADGEGFSKLSASSPDAPLEIRAASFALRREEYLAGR
jgi:hypothetical protein